MQVIDPEVPKIQFKARCDEYMYMFFQDQFLMCGRTEKLKKIEHLTNIIDNLYIKVTKGSPNVKPYENATVYERIVIFNRKLSLFRAGYEHIQLTLDEESIIKLGIIGRIFNTRASNIFRMCIFECLNFEKYDQKSAEIVSSMLTEYKIINEQLNNILAEFRLVPDNF